MGLLDYIFNFKYLAFLLIFKTFQELLWNAIGKNKGKKTEKRP